ncbi:hypothetical protein [Burkholderia sp. Ax-1724]|uniref:hypothetical protein n=1 Tax=Burkholderia sp. Ax-1724 TaxID=2608336 RepID=UPI001422F94F|nr:hypothetical protein [Burkholderia sp. Ax-1724]NIF52596.1 hypothetical protein [Burkholderia sp. Ax-1724]
MSEQRITIWSPQAGIIVRCPFPLEEDPTVPGPEKRLVYISSVRKARPNKLEEYVVLACYGSANQTTGLTTQKRITPYQFEVSNQLEFGAARLKEPTRFNLARSAPLPWTTKWFSATPDFGTLSSATKAAADKAMIEAETYLKKNPLKKFGYKPEYEKTKRGGRTIMTLIDPPDEWGD